MQRLSIIEQRLQAAFQPNDLQVIDDSQKHIGHPGAEGGAGHYTIIISAECFHDLARIAAHRKVYDVLKDLIPDEIHALSITIK